MTKQILRTKLHIPRLRPDILARDHLVTRLNAGLYRRLTLVSAPAGFGKTSIVVQWVRGLDRPVAWLSLDTHDNDLARFLAYVLHAIQTHTPGFGKTLLSALQAPQLPEQQILLTELVNELAELAQEQLLVLDDYHLIMSAEVDRALGFLLDHAPPGFHLAITTRADPNIALPRLRARGQLTELRVHELRFTDEESRHFLNQVMGLDLSAETAAALEQRTEGWIAGLQLAALSLQGRSDARTLVDSFSGGHHFVLDYLLSEVLQRQPAAVQRFLLQTSILDRFSAPLCAAVVGLADGESQTLLSHVEAANLFLIPLDGERRWFRYHHLFAGLLRQRLGETLPDEDMAEADLHIRASEWFESQGLLLEAFQHAATAADIARAERLITGRSTPLYFQGITAPIINWIDGLPESTLQANPALHIIWAGAMTVTGQPVARIENRLQKLETILAEQTSDAQTRHLTGQIAAIRAMLAIPANDLLSMLSQVDRALAYLPPEDSAYLATVQMTLGYANMLQGNLAASRQAYSEMLQLADSNENLTFLLAALIGLGNVEEAELAFHRAEQAYLRVLAEAGDPPLPYVCAAYLGLTGLAFERNDGDAVLNYGALGIKYGLQLPTVDVPAACQAYFARVHLSRGAFAETDRLLLEAEQTLRDKAINYQLAEIGSTRIQLLLRQGHLAEAAALAATHGPAALALVRLHEGDAGLALAQVAAAAGPGLDRPIDRLRLWALEATIRFSLGENEAALTLLRDALMLAAPGGLKRAFLDVGAPMVALLDHAATVGVMPGYVGQLRALLTRELAAQQGRGRQPGREAAQPLVEPLSPRELEVLQLVAAGYSNKAICDRLYLSLNTVKGHNRRIFGKLGVQRRTEAVARARALHLID